MHQMEGGTVWAISAQKLILPDFDLPVMQHRIGRSQSRRNPQTINGRKEEVEMEIEKDIAKVNG